MTCDLCGGDAFEPVVDVNRPTSLRSDRVIVNRRLIKVACARCGLVRSGSQPPEDDVAEEYASSYGSATAEHFFYTSGGPIARSAVFADWLDAHLPGELWTTGAVGLEVGASAGQLMRAVHQRHPAKPLVGVEPNVAARSAARLGGVDIRSSIDEAPGSADLAWSIAVVEHVPSPTLFLSAIRRCLSDGGRLALVQPTADVASYDILFVDHLHHFAGPHLAAYARKCGFEQVFTEVGHPLMPNFSLHIWEARAESSLSIPNAAPTQCREAAVAAIDAMARLDRLLARLAAEGRRVAVFGVHEVHALARAYSGLDTFPIVCGLDDEPERAGTRDLLFPVVRPEEARRFAVTDALLTMNANYYPTAARRCESLGLVWHGLF